MGIQRSTGEIIGFFCTDNELIEPNFLEVMVDAASHAGIDGAYTARYTLVRNDSSLSRYFALLGANDPVCWWLGKADRESYLSRIYSGRMAGTTQIRRVGVELPSLGDNGFFTKRSIIQSFVTDPKRFCSTMDLWEDIRRTNGTLTFSVVSEVSLWHRTGECLGDYLRKRWRYVNELYWNKHSIRRWRMVSSLRDWASVVGFALASLLVVPQMLVSLRGARSVKDHAWLWHSPLCFALTLLYACAMLKYLWSSLLLTVKRNSPNVSSP